MGVCLVPEVPDQRMAADLQNDSDRSTDQARPTVFGNHMIFKETFNIQT